MRIVVLLLAVLLAVPASAQGDEVRLKNGAVLMGRVVREESDKVVIDVGRGRMSVARRDIVAITLSKRESDEGSSSPPADIPATPPSRRVVVHEPPKDPADKPAATTPAKVAPVVRNEPAPAGPKVVGLERVTTSGLSPGSKAHDSKPTSKPSAKGDW